MVRSAGVQWPKPALGGILHLSSSEGPQIMDNEMTGEPTALKEAGIEGALSDLVGKGDRAGTPSQTPGLGRPFPGRLEVL